MQNKEKEIARVNGRELKFRAWDDKTKTMSAPFTLFSPDIHIYRGWKLMQYTGLKDKNGKEIYEGDVVEYLERGMKNCVGIGQVTWNKDGWNVEGFYDGSQDEPGRAFSENAQLEIIGNVWENPELIEK